MGGFSDWLKKHKKVDENWLSDLWSVRPESPEKQAKHQKLALMKKWLADGEKTPQPVAQNDPDMAWIQKKLAKAGSSSQSGGVVDPMNVYGAGRGVVPF